MGSLKGFLQDKGHVQKKGYQGLQIIGLELFWKTEVETELGSHEMLAYDQIAQNLPQ